MSVDRENLVSGRTRSATVRLTVTRATDDKQLPSLFLRATEWAGLAVAATGVTVIIDRFS